MAFEYLWYEAWSKSVDAAKAGLQATLVIRHPSNGKLYVNFDREILLLIRETKCLMRMGVQVPPSARMVVLGCHPRGTGALQVFSMTRADLKLEVEVGACGLRIREWREAAEAASEALPDPFCARQSEKHAAFKCGTFGASSLAERHLATGDFDGRLAIWCDADPSRRSF